MTSFSRFEFGETNKRNQVESYQHSHIIKLKYTYNHTHTICQVRFSVQVQTDRNENFKTELLPNQLPS